MHSKFILLLFLAILTLDRNFNEALIFKFSNFVCASYNKSLILIPLCRIRAIGRNKNSANFVATWLHPVNDIKAHFRVFKKANGFKPWMFDTKINLCQFLIKPNNVVFSLMYKQFKNYSNLVGKQCPLVGNMSVHNFELDFKNFKLPLPTGEYLFAISWYLNKKLTVDTNATIQFVEDFSTFEIEKSLSHL